MTHAANASCLDLQACRVVVCYLASRAEGGMPYANRLVILREPATEHMNCITAHVKWAIRLYQQPGVGQLCTGHRTRHVDRSLKGADFKLWGEGCHGAGTFTSRFQSVRGCSGLQSGVVDSATGCGGGVVSESNIGQCRSARQWG